MPKKQFTITIEPEIIKKLDEAAKRMGISRNAATSLLICKYSHCLYPYRHARPNHTFPCNCAKCLKEQDEGERAFEDDYQNSRS